MTPLPDQVSILLRSSPTAAMAALLLISTSHRGLFDWASKAICGQASIDIEPRPKPKAAARRARKANGHRKPRGGDSRLPARDEADKRLLEAMRKNPDGVINDWVVVVGKSRTSVVAGLYRLRAAGLAKSDEGKWALTEDPPPREPPAKWISPVSARAQRALAGTL
jgi:hypothetical protein